MRDDFTDPTKRQLAARVGYHCSNPDCRASASGPQLDAERSVNLGVAAHITAASPTGPRFNPTICSSDRTSIDNAIWLCQKCAKLVDSDLTRFSVQVLQEWKRSAEQVALFNLGKTYTEVHSTLDPDMPHPGVQLVFDTGSTELTIVKKNSDQTRQNKYLGRVRC